MLFFVPVRVVRDNNGLLLEAIWPREE